MLYEVIQLMRWGNVVRVYYSPAGVPWPVHIPRLEQPYFNTSPPPPLHGARFTIENGVITWPTP